MLHPLVSQASWLYHLQFRKTQNSDTSNFMRQYEIYFTFEDPKKPKLSTLHGLFQALFHFSCKEHNHI